MTSQPPSGSDATATDRPEPTLIDGRPTTEIRVCCVGFDGVDDGRPDELRDRDGARELIVRTAASGDDVLADVREDLRIPLEESDAALTVDDLPRVRGDASQLRQVFQNLVSNAIEYSGDEPPRIRVEAERADDPAVAPLSDDRWVVSVSDEGIGIDPDEQERIFEVFERLHGREEYSGTGIGLALCQRIVERHGVRASEASSSSTGSRSESVGGGIRVDSDPGEGSTFSVVLPAADGE